MQPRRGCSCISPIEETADSESGANCSFSLEFGRHCIVTLWSSLSPLSPEGFVWTIEKCPIVPFGLTNTHLACGLLGKHMWKGKAKLACCNHAPHPAPSSSECKGQWGVTSFWRQRCSWLHWHCHSVCLVILAGRLRIVRLLGSSMQAHWAREAAGTRPQTPGRSTLAIWNSGMEKPAVPGLSLTKKLWQLCQRVSGPSKEKRESHHIPHYLQGPNTYHFGHCPELQPVVRWSYSLSPNIVYINHWMCQVFLICKNKPKTVESLN